MKHIKYFLVGFFIIGGVLGLIELMINVPYMEYIVSGVVICISSYVFGKALIK